MTRTRQIPTRTCVACGTTRPKRELVRVVRTPEGSVLADPTGRRNGRGAYLDPDAACLDRGLASGAISRALEVAIADADRERLRTDLAAIARERAQPKEAR